MVWIVALAVALVVAAAIDDLTPRQHAILKTYDERPRSAASIIRNSPTLSMVTRPIRAPCSTTGIV